MCYFFVRQRFLCADFVVVVVVVADAAVFWSSIVHCEVFEADLVNKVVHLLHLVLELELPSRHLHDFEEKLRIVADSKTTFACNI